MAVKIYQGHSPELAYADVNVVIDVIRAFTFAHYAFIKGVKEILLAQTTDSAFQLKKKYPGCLLAGEENGLYIPGFDLDNSPMSLLDKELAGKTLVQKTTNGVKAALNALQADHVFVTGFSNARTTAAHIQKTYGAKKTIQIIASHPSGDDDLACAEYMKDIIETKSCRLAAAAASRIKGSEAAQKFFDANRPEFKSSDITLCAQELNFSFLMKVVQKNNLPRIVRVEL